MAMKENVVAQIQSMRTIVQQLLDIEQSSLNTEQSEDVHHILSALDAMEHLTPILETIPKLNLERMQILHDITSPINGIIGYLYILEQGYSAPLTEKQHQLIKSIETKINLLYQYINNKLTSSPVDT